MPLVDEPKLAFAHLRRIQISSSGKSASSTGIFAASASAPAKEDEIDGLALLLQVAGGNGQLYANRYTAGEICIDLKLDRSTILSQSAAGGIPSSSSLSPEVDHLVGLLTSTLLKEGEVNARQITFEATGDDALRISIKERMKSGMVRLLWSTQLVSDTSNSSLFDLSLRLLVEQEDVSGELASAKAHCGLLERDRDGWRDTAQKLEGEWEKEKAILFQNFCVLYTGKEAQTKTMVDDLQREIDKLKDEVVTAKAVHTGSMRHELPECLKTVPDDVDGGAGYDAETVALLAQGKRLPEPKKRTNPFTGATEYLDVDAALKDVLLPALVPPLAKKPRVAVKKESSKPAAVAKREPKVKPAAKKTKAQKPPPPVAAASDSDTGSDDDFVDKDMQAQIMADLAALKKS